MSGVRAPGSPGQATRAVAGYIRAQQRLREALDSPRHRRLCHDLDSLVDLAPPANVRDRWVRKRVRKALRRADRLLDQATGEPGRDDRGPGRDDRGPGRDERLHEARKAYKRAWYAVGVLQPLTGKPARRLAKQLGKLQDVLGTHQDTVITRAVLRQQAGQAYRAGDNTFTYGLLHARQRVAADAALGALPGAAGNARRAKVRSWLG